MGKITLIKKLVDKIKDQYDFILFDCPPSIETIVVNALLASNRIIIPVELEAKSLSIMKRNSAFLNRLKNTTLGNGAPIGFSFDKVLVVPNKFKRENIKAKALFMLQDIYASGERGIEISQVHIPNSAIVDKCSEAQEPIYLSATRYGKEFKSNVKPGKDFTNYFWVIMHEILDAPIDRLPFPGEEYLDGSQEA